MVTMVHRTQRPAAELGQPTFVSFYYFLLYFLTSGVQQFYAKRCFTKEILSSWTFIENLQLVKPQDHILAIISCRGQ
jgi:hypothetical protein